MLAFVWLLLCAISLLPAESCAANDELANGAPAPGKPNIVLINIDDCDVDLVSDQRLQYYPNLKQLADSSVRFTNCHVTTPLCGPSRACLFRSQYAHNTGYRTNRANLDVGSGFTGGTQFFLDSGLADDQLAVWMKQAGYHNMLDGKYFQGKTDHVPLPGWDRFVAFGGNSYHSAVRFDFYQDGKKKIDTRVGYRSDLETDEAIELLDQYSREVDPEKPFFLYVAPVAPHSGTPGEDPVPARWKDRFQEVDLPSSENFNEQDVSDKPVVYRDTLPLSKKELANLKLAQRRRLIAMLGIDEMVKRIREKIADIGQADNTILIFTSDHGYLLGQHRMHGKSFPLVEATQVPLWVHWPEKCKPRDAGQLLAHIDISATIAELGGASLPDFVDGRSFSKVLLDDSITDADVVRESVLVENWESRLNSVSKQKVVYSSIIEPGSMYTQWATGEHEYYNLKSDPYQLKNGYESLDAATKSSLQAKLLSLRRNVTRESGTTATISFPTVNRKFIGPNIELEGFAESDTPSGPVNFSIRRKTTGEYWNGSGWDKELIQLPTESPIGAGFLYAWRAKPNVTGVESGEVLTIEMHAKETSKQNASVSKLDVTYDLQPPTVTVIRPASQNVYPKFSNFGGTISDDHGPEDVRLFIFDIVSKRYFDGEQWTTQKNSVSVLINRQRGLWHAFHPLPDGRYEVSAIGKDAAGNWSEPAAPNRCVIDSKQQRRKKLKDEIR